MAVAVALLAIVEISTMVSPVVGIDETWVNGTAEPAVQVAAAPRLMLLSIGSP
jgi:hypothetical protein